MGADTSVIAEMTVQLIVTRCGCDKPETHIDAPCPTPREAPTDLGIVGRWAPEE